MTTLVSDAFTDTAGTALASHTPGTGGAWSLHPSYTGTVVISNANRARGNDNNAACYINATTPASADYNVRVTMRRLSLDVHVHVGVVGRCNTGADTMYRLYFDTQSNGAILAKIVAGVETSLGTSAVAGAYFQDEDYIAELRMSGTTIKAFIRDPFADGGVLTEKISVTDSAIAAVGRGGIFANGPTSGGPASNTIGPHLDDFLLDGTAGGGGGGYTPAEFLRQLAGGFSGLRGGF